MLLNQKNLSMQSWKFKKIEKFWLPPHGSGAPARIFRFFKISNFALKDFLSVALWVRGGNIFCPPCGCTVYMYVMIVRSWQKIYCFFTRLRNYIVQPARCIKWVDFHNLNGIERRNIYILSQAQICGSIFASTKIPQRELLIGKSKNVFYCCWNLKSM